MTQRYRNQRGAASYCVSQPCTGVGGSQPFGPQPPWHLPGEARPDSHSSAQNPPFYTQIQQQSGQGRRERRQTPSCPLTPCTSLCSVPAPTHSQRHPLPATCSQGTVPEPLPLLAFATAPTDHCLLSRCAALSEISILGCRKVYLRRVRRDPC